MRRVVRSRAGNPYQPRRTVAAFSAVAACCFLSAAPSAASGPADPGASASESPESSASGFPQSSASGFPQPSASVAPGETFDYALTVTNNGPSQAEQIRVSDTLPTALSFVSGDATCTSGRTVTCGTLPRLAPGASVTWVIKVKLDPEYTGSGSDIRNTATVDSLTGDPEPANNTSAAAGPPGGTVKDPTADLEVGKTTP